MTAARAHPRAATRATSAKEDELLGFEDEEEGRRPRHDDGVGSGGATPRPRGASKSVETVASKASDEPSDASPRRRWSSAWAPRRCSASSAGRPTRRAAGLGPYSLTPGPETGAWLEFYPAAFGTSGFAANVGLFGRFDYGFGVATTLANGMDVATKFRDFMAGLKVRIPSAR